MGQWLSAGQQVHVLPSLLQLAESYRTPVNWVGLRPISRWRWGEQGDRAVGQVSPWPMQTWGQGLGFWGAPEHRERTLLKLLLTHSHQTPAQFLDGGMFLGPDLLAALFLSFSCPQRRSFRDFVYSFWITVIHSKHIYLLLWRTWSSLVSVLRILWSLVFLEMFFHVLPEKSHVSPAYPAIGNNHQNRNSVTVQHALLSHLWFWKNTPFFCIRTLSNQKYKNVSAKNTPNVKISRFPTILILLYIYMDTCAWVTDVDKQ